MLLLIVDKGQDLDKSVERSSDETLRVGPAC